MNVTIASIQSELVMCSKGATSEKKSEGEKNSGTNRKERTRRTTTKMIAWRVVDECETEVREGRTRGQPKRDRVHESERN